MNDLFQEKKSLFIVIVGLLFVLLLVLYIAVFRPLANEVTAKETDKRTLQQEISQNEQKLAEAEKQDPEIDTISVKRQLPSSRELDELLLMLEKNAQISSSRIENMEFSYDQPLADLEQEEEGEDQDATDEAKEAPSEEEETTATEDEGEEEGSDAAQHVMETVANSVHTVQLRVQIFSPDYKQFKQFLKEVEKLERLTIVHTIEMKQPGEIERNQAEKPDKTVEYYVELMTFYDEN
ncbi:hypothetical protein [Virgibacillus proomii]|uniref:hypothetical protein n=1 Tax=Virgibacillus proomii TaxID=84407 RepID=UPI001C0F6388|nr:hypothetical protein [Virgibacillus proomii]MBU5265694.1 hypothetical protein [Virgibacillus proomii]